MGITSIQVVSIPVSDQERSRAFYCDALGFEVTSDFEIGPTMRWLQLGIPDTEISITLVTWFVDMPPGSLRGLVLGVSEIDALAAKLFAQGYLDDGTVKEEEWGRHFVLSDPDGNSLVLNETDD